MEDKEKLPITATSCYRGGNLPDFIKFKDGTTFLIEPTQNGEVGTYQIVVALDDGYCQFPKFYSFIVTIEKGRPLPKVSQDEKQKCDLRIVQVSRDGNVEFKLLMPTNLRMIKGFAINYTEE